MRAKTHEFKIGVIRLAIDQDEIGHDMAVAVIVPLPRQPVIEIPARPPSVGREKATGREVLIHSTDAGNTAVQLSLRNLAAEKAAGVGHHVALSVVGTERLLTSGYFRAKLAQEALIKAAQQAVSQIRSIGYRNWVRRLVGLETS